MVDSVAKAYPRKHFFVEMFTRDLSLTDCILDLIDNSIDGLMRSRQIDIASAILTEAVDLTDAEKGALPTVRINFSEKRFSIEDTCGGIPFNDALNDVFNFGHGAEYNADASATQLGVYGVGLKRAIFKLGRVFEMTSETHEDGFSLHVDLDQWLQNDRMLTDWTFPIKKSASVRSAKRAGTRIVVKGLREEIRMAMSDGSFGGRLCAEIAKTYALFLDRYVRIFVDDRAIAPVSPPMGASAEVTPGREILDEDGVKVTILAGLAARDEQDEWVGEHAGWYVACNGRMIVTADKTERTGWGSGALPSWHSKFRGFVGLVIFQSSDPLKLPWTTTKRGLHHESLVYQRVCNRMRVLARPVISFLNSMYPDQEREQGYQRKLAQSVRVTDVRTVAHGEPATFDAGGTTERRAKTTVSIQYDAEKSDIALIRKHLRRPGMSCSRIGRHTFAAFIKMEGLK